MTTKLEVLDAIRQGTADVLRTFGSLSDDQLCIRVHQSDGGWTAKEVLAHLAAGGEGHARLLQRAVEGGAAFGDPGDMDERNRRLVNEQLGKSRDVLLAGFHAAQDTLCRKVQELSDDALARPLTLPRGGERPLADVLIMIAGRHPSGHAQEVDRALAVPAAK
jgi:hypothetical protein